MHSPRRIDLVLLMGPPGSGKSTLGTELDRLGLAAYTELEAKLVLAFGQGKQFARRRAEAHRWIRDFYRRALATVSLPVVMETTGIADRPFIDDLSTRYRPLFVKLTTSRDCCVARVTGRPRGRHANDHDADGAGEFYDHWHDQVAPTYRFDLTVGGTDLEADATSIRKVLTVS